MTRLRCAIVGIRTLSEHVREIRLRPISANIPTFYAGQYLKILHPSGHEIPYSIANPPAADTLELHYQAIEGTDDARLMDELLAGDELTVELPFGHCFVDAPIARPLIIAAAATGYAQARSVLEHVLPSGLDQALHLYWGAKTSQELYDVEHLKLLASTTTNFFFQPTVELPDVDWHGRCGNLASAIAEDFTDLSQVDVMLCGGPVMVYATFDALAGIGLRQSNARSDVFDYAPRERDVAPRD